MEGCVITEELNVNKLQAGVICILKNKDRLTIVTIQHLDPDSKWVVSGVLLDDYVVPVEAELCKLVVIDDKGVYPLKFSQWKKAIANDEVGTEKRVTFELTPTVFNEGKYINVCHECTAQFLGGRNQSICQGCCDEDVIAKITINKTVKPKRPRVKSTTDIKALALTSYEMGVKAAGLSIGPDVFDEWLEKQF